jgi:hypothetical protein
MSRRFLRPFFVSFVSFCSNRFALISTLALRFADWQSFPNLPKVPASRSPIMSVTILTVVAPLDFLSPDEAETQSHEDF